MPWRRERLTRLVRFQGGICNICKRIMFGTGTRRPTTDHIVPRSKGGGDHSANVQAACWDCNQSKADTIPFEESEVTNWPVQLPNDCDF